MFYTKGKEFPGIPYVHSCSWHSSAQTSPNSEQIYTIHEVHSKDSVWLVGGLGAQWDPHNTFYEKIITISQSVLEGGGFVFAHVQCAHSRYLEKKVIFSLICCKCVGSLDYTLNILWVSVGICSQWAICSTYLWVYMQSVCYLWVSLGSAGTEVSSAQSLTMHFARHLSAQNHRLCCRSAQQYMVNNTGFSTFVHLNCTKALSARSAQFVQRFVLISHSNLGPVNTSHATCKYQPNHPLHQPHEYSLLPKEE